MRGRVSWRMEPLCTWQSRLWGADLGAQEESREERERGQRQTGEGRGRGDTTEGRDPKGLISDNIGDKNMHQLI